MDSGEGGRDELLPEVRLPVLHSYRTFLSKISILPFILCRLVLWMVANGGVDTEELLYMCGVIKIVLAVTVCFSELV